MADTDKKTNSDYKAVRAQYFREWRARNKDKVSQYNRTYWMRRAEKEQAKLKEENN